MTQIFVASNMTRHAAAINAISAATSPSSSTGAPRADSEAAAMTTSPATNTDSRPSVRSRGHSVSNMLGRTSWAPINTRA